MTAEEYDKQKEQAKKDLAACYARLFLGSEDGLRVLADMRSKFGTERPVFQRAPGQRFDALEAAILEGQRRPMMDIEAALKSSNPQLWAESLI